jgi:hypothetical protein
MHQTRALNKLTIRCKFRKVQAPKFPGAPSLSGLQLQKARKEESMQTSAKARRSAAQANTQEEIRRRAYELHEARGREHGHDVEDTLEAEAEITGGTENVAA